MTESTAGLVRVPAELPEVRILRVQPGDVLVLRHELHLTPQDLEQIRSDMALAMPGHPCIVLDGGLTLDSVLTQGGEQDHED